MKRVAVFASYSKDGIIAEYVLYYLRGLKKVVSDIIFIADNEVLEGEEKKIDGLVTYCKCERHGCYDFGSYRRGFEWAEKNGILKDADELIFCNDSCYGPIFPFEEVFTKMESRNCDFWGLVASSQIKLHLQSYFLVFNNNVFSSTSFKTFVSSFEKQDDFWGYVEKYETCFAEYLANAGFTFSSLIDNTKYEKLCGGSPINPTFFPLSVLKERLPLIKRKIFGHQHRTLVKESLEKTILAIKSINPEVYNLIWYYTNAVVLIPVYKEELSDDEKMSLMQVLKVLALHDIRFVCPQKLNMSAYDNIIGYSLPKERFPNKFFDGIAGYNDLMTSMCFYRRFSDKKYMLIYQLDAWVFSDQLAEWCAKGYDYVGAPWFEKHKTHEEGFGFWCCGNGGLSLRLIPKFIETTNPQTLFLSRMEIFEKYFKDVRTWGKGIGRLLGRKNNMVWYRKERSDLWEDTFFSYGLEGTSHELRRPSPEEAAEFSFECSPAFLFKFIGERLPFGCHAWRKFQYNDFWCDYIKTTGSVMKQKVSIITINYNNLEGLKSTRDSIVCQTYSNYEWIVIDGGSSDGAKDYLTEHTSEISYWCSEKDSGVYNAQNKGLMKASGDYLIFMNSGDTFYDERVIENVFSNPQHDDVLYGNWVRVFPNGKKWLIEPSHNADYAFFYSDNICHQAMFIKASTLKESQYDESYKLYADWAKWTEFAYQGKTFKYFPHYICNFMMGGMSGENEQNNEKERKRIIEEFYPGSLRSMMTRWNNGIAPDIEEELHRLSNKNTKHLKQLRFVIIVASVLLLVLISILFWIFSNQ